MPRAAAAAAAISAIIIIIIINHRNTSFIHITIIMEFKCGVIFQTNNREKENKNGICYIFSLLVRTSGYRDIHAFCVSTK